MTSRKRPGKAKPRVKSDGDMRPAKNAISLPTKGRITRTDEPNPSKVFRFSEESYKEEYGRMLKEIEHNKPEQSERWVENIRTMRGLNVQYEVLQHFMKLHRDRILDATLDNQDNIWLDRQLYTIMGAATEHNEEERSIVKALRKKPQQCEEDLASRLEKRYGIKIGKNWDLTKQSRHLYDRGGDELFDRTLPPTIENILMLYDQALEIALNGLTRTSREGKRPKNNIPLEELIKQTNRYHTRNGNKRRLTHIGLGVGNGKKELYWTQRLMDYFLVTSIMTDKNESMLVKAVGNYDRAGLNTERIRLDFMKELSSKRFSDAPGSFVITMFGGTAFNLPDRTQLFRAVYRTINNRPRFYKEKSIFIIEGHKDKDLKYYSDEKSIDFFMHFAGAMLDIPREHFMLGDCVTHYVEYDPQSQHVEIYGIITKDIKIKGQFELKTGDVLKLAISGKISEEDITDELYDAGFKDLEFVTDELEKTDHELIFCYASGGDGSKKKMQSAPKGPRNYFARGIPELPGMIDSGPRHSTQPEK